MSTATIPTGLTELLEEFAVSVLREKPSDLVEFAAQYFTNLRDQRGGGINQTTLTARAGPAPTEDQMESDNMAAGVAGREIEMTTQDGTIISCN